MQSPVKADRRDVEHIKTNNSRQGGAHLWCWPAMEGDHVALGVDLEMRQAGTREGGERG